MATREEELRKALDLAIDDGNSAKARELAMRIAAMEREPNPAAQAFTEASRTRTAVEGTLADRERMMVPPQREAPRPLGTASEFMRGIPRGAYNAATIPATVGAMLPDTPVAPLAARQELAQGVQQFGERTFGPPSDTVMGRSGEFVGGGGVGGLPNIMRSTANAGVRGLVGSTTRNVGSSVAAAAGAEAGGNLAANTGLPRMLGETIGALTPSFLTGSAGRVLTGANQKQRAANSLVAQEALNDAKRLGLMDAISAGTASPNSRTKFFERLLSSVPGGMRTMHEFARKLNARLTGTLQRTTGRRSAEEAGVSLSSGINRRIDGLVARNNARYARAARAIDPDSPVQPTGFQTAIADIRGANPDSVDDIISTIRTGKTDLIPQLDEALTKLTTIGQAPGITATRALTYSEADAIRKAIGQEIAGSTVLAPNPQIGELKKLYAALSDDVTNSLSGQQKALYTSAAKGWSESRATIDQILEPTLGGKGNIKFDEIYRRTFKGGGESTKSLREVYRGLNATERETVTKTFIAKMGRVGDEALTEAGEIPLNPNFRMQTFITNWRKMPAESKDVIFQGQKQLREDMDTFVRHVDRVLETNAAFANPSQSGPVGLAAATAYLTLAGAAGAGIGYVAGSEDGEALTAAGGGIAGLLLAAKSAQWSARLMTNPSFVSWLARGTRVPIAKTPEHFGRLSTLVANEPELAEDVATFLNELSNYTDIRNTYGPRAGEQ